MEIIEFNLISKDNIIVILKYFFMEMILNRFKMIYLFMEIRTLLTYRVNT